MEYRDRQRQRQRQRQSRYGRAPRDGEIDAVEHAFLGSHLVRKHHIAQLELTADVAAIQQLASVKVDVRQRVKHLEHPLRRAARSRELHDDVIDRLVGPPYHVPVELKGDELADRQRTTGLVTPRHEARDDDTAAVPQDQDARDEVGVLRKNV